jgi:DNA polymerase-3 subunit epsilon
MASGPAGTVFLVNWYEGRLAAYDIETTGTDTETDRIVTAAVTVVGGGLPTESRTWLVDPGVEIPEEATGVHGITNEMARSEGQSAQSAVEEITSFLALQVADDIPIVAFNARFDLTILDREARRHGVEPLIERIGGADGLLVIDPYVLEKRINQFRKGRRTLTILCEDYGIPLTDAHAADADALAAARLAWKLGRINAELGSYDLPTLHEDQIAWADEQGRSLQEYFDREGRGEVVQTVWPLIPYAA